MATALAVTASTAPRVYGLDAICAAALAIGGEEAAHFARRLYARVADKDLAAAPADQRAGAAVSLLAFARRRLPGVAKVRVFNTDRRPRLREPPHHRADRQRRHAVPGRFDRQRVQSPRDQRPSAGASGAGGAARPRRRPSGLRPRSRRARQVRIDDAHRDRPPGRSRAARRACRRAHPRAGRGAAGGRGLAGDAPRLPRRHRRSRRQPLAQPRRVRRFPALAGSRPFHLPRPSPLSLRRGREPARRPALRDRRRARRSASCAATRCGCSRPASAAARRCRASPAGRTTS